MRHGTRVLVLLCLTLGLSCPALAQRPAPARAIPGMDQEKAYLIGQEYVAATGELRGRMAAKRAELETVLATKPDDAAAIKALVGEIAAMRTSLFEQSVQFRLRLAKEAGVPVRYSRHLGMFGLGGPRGMMGPGPRGRGMPHPALDMSDDMPPAADEAKAPAAKKP